MPEPPRNNNIFSQNARSLLGNQPASRFPNLIDKNPYQLQNNAPHGYKDKVSFAIPTSREEEYNIFHSFLILHRLRRLPNPLSHPNADVNAFPERVKDTRRYDPILHVDMNSGPDSDALYPQPQHRSRTQEPKPSQAYPEPRYSYGNQEFRHSHAKQEPNHSYSIPGQKHPYTVLEPRSSYNVPEPRHSFKAEEQRYSYEPLKNPYFNDKPEYSSPYHQPKGQQYPHSATLTSRQQEFRPREKERGSYSPNERVLAPWDKNGKNSSANARLSNAIHTPMVQNRNIISNEVNSYMHPQPMDPPIRVSSFNIEPERLSFKPKESPRKTEGNNDTGRPSYNQLDSTIKVTSKEVVISPQQNTTFPFDMHQMLKRKMLNIKAGPNAATNMSPQERAKLWSNFQGRMNQLDNRGSRLTVQEALEKRVILSLDQVN